MTDTKPIRERVLLVGIYDKHAAHARAAAEADMEELGALAASAGADVVGAVLQPRERSRSVGEGKLDEVRAMVQAEGITLVVSADELTGHAAREWEDRLDVRVIDRTELILDIFARRAKSREGRLQVEMAQLTYRLPRLQGGRSGLSRTGGGIGTRGPGETRLEVDRRRVRDRLRALGIALEQVDRDRHVRRVRRAGRFLPTVALVGYTNVGKSSLFARLTRREAEVEDKLFKTLDPGVRRIHVTGFGPALLVDTVGFVHRLPHALVAAFKSTLDEVRDADLLLEVVDASRPDDRDAAVVDEVLREVGADHLPRILVENKWDRVPPDRWPKGVPVSAAAGWNLEELVAALGTALAEWRAPVEVVVPWAAGEVLGWIQQEGEILDQRPDPAGGGSLVRFSAPPSVVGRVRRRLET